MEIAVTLSQEFFKEHFGVLERIELWDSLVTASENLCKLSRLAYDDGDLNQFLDLHRLSFELDCLCNVISDTLKKE